MFTQEDGGSTKNGHLWEREREVWSNVDFHFSWINTWIFIKKYVKYYWEHHGVMPIEKSFAQFLISWYFWNTLHSGLFPEDQWKKQLAAMKRYWKCHTETASPSLLNKLYTKPVSRSLLNRPITVLRIIV